MTIPSTPRKAGPYVGNGSQTSWPFSFKVFSDSDLRVTRTNETGDEIVLTKGTDYTVSLNANQESSPGGTVTCTLAAGRRLAVTGAIAYDQPLDLPSGGNFSPIALENQLDRTTMQVQQLAEQMARAVKVPITEDGDGELSGALAQGILALAPAVDDVQAVAGEIDNLAAVADSIGTIATVGGSIDNVNTVGANISRVNTVANNTANINTVAGSIANVNTVAADISEVTAVGGSIANINAVAGKLADVETVADNLADVSNFADVYYGPSASDPTTRRDSSPLQDGDLYYNTGSKRLRVFNGTAWVDGLINAGALNVQSFSGTGAQTAFPLAVDPAGENNTQVFISGVYQAKSEYSVSGTTLTFSSAPPAGTDNIEVVTISTLALGETDASFVTASDEAGGSLFTTVQGFITRLMSSAGSALVGFIQSGTGAVFRWLQDKLREIEKSPQDYGAVANGSADDSAAIQSAINAVAALGGGTVKFPAGQYKIDYGVTLASNVTLRGESGAVIKPSDLVPSWAFRGVSTNNVVIEGLTFEGTGTAYSTGTQRLVQIESGSSIVIRGCTFTKARESGLVLDACNYAHISNCNFTRNYVYGGEARNGSSNVTIDSCVFELNGNTGTATSAFGRGFVLWNCSNSTVNNSVFHQNTEYGLRLYSRVGDAGANRNITITGCSFRDNGTTASGKNDLNVYNEHGGTERVAISGCTFSVRSGNFGAVLSGNTISLTGCTFTGVAPQAGYGVSLYGSTNVTVSGNTFTNLAYVAGFSATAGAVSTNCTISNNQCVGVVEFAGGGIQGTGHIISGNYIKKGGAGATDVGFTITSANVSAAITGNVVDGFYRGFSLASNGDYITIKDNRTLNSTGTGFFAQYQTDVSKIICTNNSFESAYPTVWATMFADSANSYGRKFFVANATPVSGGVGGGANITWKVGDRVFNSAPAVGSPKSWVCTVAGAPGTWVSEGNL